MEYNVNDTFSSSIKLQNSKKHQYMAPAIIPLELESQDIASGGPNPGPDGTSGNNPS